MIKNNTKPTFISTYSEVKETDSIRSYKDDLYLLNKEYLFFEKIPKSSECYVVNKLIDGRIRDKVSPNIIEAVVKKLHMDSDIELQEDLVNQADFINLKNCVLQVSTLKMFQKDIEKYPFTYIINANYLDKRGIEEAPKKHFLKFLDDAMEGDKSKKKFLLSILGYLFTDYLDARTMIFFIGKTASGKSLICDVIQKLIGKEHISNMSLTEITSRFNVSKLDGCKLNISTELNTNKIPNSGMLKAIISNDFIYGDVKFGEGKHFKCKTKLLQVANCLPALKSDDDSEGAFKDRLTVVCFNRSVDKKDRDTRLIYKLYEELDAIFTLSIKAFKEEVLDQIPQKGFTFNSPQESIDYVKNYCISEVEIVEQFINEECEIGLQYREHSCVLYEQFKQFCLEKNFQQIVKEKDFKDTLEILLEQYGGYKHKFEKKGHNRRGYVGIQLKSVN